MENDYEIKYKIDRDEDEIEIMASKAIIFMSKRIFDTIN